MADLKIIERFTKPMKMLGDAELGRLVHAMLDYLVDGTDTDLRGNERFLWDDAKASIDRQKRLSKVRSDVGKIGADAHWHSKPIANDSNGIANDSKPIANDEQEKNQKKDIYNSPLIENSTPSIPQKPEMNSTTVRNESNTPTTVPSRSSVVTQSVKPSRNVIPPTLQMVSDYCESRRNGIDPQAFIDHYTSNGWMVGKTRMKDWQAAVRTWERNSPVKGAGVKKDRFANLKRLYEETED